MRLVVISLLALVLGVGLGWRPAKREKSESKAAGLVRERAGAVNAAVDVPEEDSWIARIREVKTLSDLEMVFGVMKEQEVQLSGALRFELARCLVAVDPEGGVRFLLRERKDQVNREVLGSLFAEWMTRDLDTALARLGGLSNNALYRDVLSDLLGRDVPELCVVFLRETGPFWLHGTARDPRWLDVARKRTREFSDVLVQWDGSGSSFLRREVLPLVLVLGDCLYERGPEEGVAWMKELPDRLKMVGLGRVLRRWAEDDVTAVLQYLDDWKNSDAGEHELVSTLMNGDLNRHLATAMTKRDLPQAVRWVGEHGNSVGRAALRDVVAERLASGELSVDTVYDEVFLHNAGIQAHGFSDALGGLWVLMSGEQKEKALERLQGKEAGQAKTTALSGLLRSWMRRKPEEAGAAMSRMAAGPERDQVLGEVLRGMANSYRAQVAADFVAAVPNEHRAAAVDAFYSKEPDPEDRGGGIVYPGTLAEGLEGVPDAEGRLRAMRKVAGVWGTVDPEKALEWAGGLQGTEQWEATTAVARGWAGQDMWALAEHVESLPRGQGRDATIRGLAGHASRENPETAWMWCGEIEDGAARHATRMDVMRNWVESDAQAAREALNTADLGVSEREELRAMLTP